MKTVLFTVGLALATSSALAQSAAPPTDVTTPKAAPPSAPAPTTPATAATTVPAVDRTAALASVDTASALPPAPGAGFPPPVNLTSGRQPKLTPRERVSVQISDDWKTAQFHPGRGNEGQVLFRFGATMPTLVCAPLYACNVELQPGEIVNNVNAGDDVRWKISPAVSGSGANAVTHVIIKPTDSNLATNLIITTDRRTYEFKLISRLTDWMQSVAFTYPEDEQREWAALAAAQAKQRADNTMPDTGQNIDHLDFGYRLSGDRPSWTPIRVYTDGVKTYIEFPASMRHGDAPALVVLGHDGGIFSSPSKQLVNYRVIGDRYIVDKVLDRAALISSVGKAQTKVEINHTGKE